MAQVGNILILWTHRTVGKSEIEVACMTEETALSLFEKLFLDIVDPFLLPSVWILEALVIVVEAVVIFFLMERRAPKAFAASFAANLLTGLLSIVFMFFPLEFGFAYISTLEEPIVAFILVSGLIINILVEAGVLKLFYRATGAGKIFKVSIVMNLISYAIVVLNLVLLDSL
jgi:hypothetical protein